MRPRDISKRSPHLIEHIRLKGSVAAALKPDISSHIHEKHTALRVLKRLVTPTCHALKVGALRDTALDLQIPVRQVHHHTPVPIAIRDN